MPQIHHSVVTLELEFHVNGVLTDGFALDRISETIAAIKKSVLPRPDYPGETGLTISAPKITKIEIIKRD